MPNSLVHLLLSGPIEGIDVCLSKHIPNKQFSHLDPFLIIKVECNIVCSIAQNPGSHSRFMVSEYLVVVAKNLLCKGRRTDYDVQFVTKPELVDRTIS
ncbi:hypothetical protein M5689_007873 [Euphorbia peplus]|nr:hypothetical protein M5689_007873 [Euphorbia peplus]